MKRIISAIILLMMLLSIIPVSAHAASTENMSFSFEISVDGKQEKTVQTGDIITIVFFLNRTDSDGSYTMYAMQNEIRYDSRFFKLVEGSAIVSRDIRTSDIALRDRHREFYMNYVSMGYGATWNAKQLIGSFQLQVIATQGVSLVTCEDTLVSHRDGMGSYDSVANMLTIKVSDKCLIEFHTDDGATPINAVNVKVGKKLPRPENPTREGYYFAGWYKDVDRTEKWDFDKDVVEENTTLYAKWSKNATDYDEYVPTHGGDLCKYIIFAALGLLLIILFIIIIILLLKKKVTFESNGGTPVKSVRVFKGKRINRPENPVRAGYSFVGWAKDEACTLPWFFGKDEVNDNITLYAKWKKD